VGQSNPTWIKAGPYDYSIAGDPLGVGGFGEVYGGQWRQRGGHGGSAAIKIYHQKRLGTGEDRKKVIQSLQTALRLQQRLAGKPGIRRVFNTGDIDQQGRLVVGMALIQGTNMMARVRDFNVAYNDDRIRSEFGQMIKSAAACHEAKIWHRDFKPENFLYDSRTRNIFLSDFDLAVTGKSSDDHTCGTDLFWPPDQVQALMEPKKENRKLWALEAADVYAMGVTLLTIVLRRFPYEIMPHLRNNPIKDRKKIKYLPATNPLDKTKPLGLGFKHSDEYRKQVMKQLWGTLLTEEFIEFLATVFRHFEDDRIDMDTFQNEFGWVPFFTQAAKQADKQKSNGGRRPGLTLRDANPVERSIADVPDHPRQLACLGPVTDPEIARFANAAKHGNMTEKISTPNPISNVTVAGSQRMVRTRRRGLL
jgi:serine/threonine protein kinase